MSNRPTITVQLPGDDTDSEGIEITPNVYLDALTMGRLGTEGLQSRLKYTDTTSANVKKFSSIDKKFKRPKEFLDKVLRIIFPIEMNRTGDVFRLPPGKNDIEKVLRAQIADADTASFKKIFTHFIVCIFFIPPELLIATKNDPSKLPTDFVGRSKSPTLNVGKVQEFAFNLAFNLQLARTHWLNKTILPEDKAKKFLAYVDDKLKYLSQEFDLCAEEEDQLEKKRRELEVTKTKKKAAMDKYNELRQKDEKRDAEKKQVQELDVKQKDLEKATEELQETIKEKRDSYVPDPDEKLKNERVLRHGLFVGEYAVVVDRSESKGKASPKKTKKDGDEEGSDQASEEKEESAESDENPEPARKKAKTEALTFKEEDRLPKGSIKVEDLEILPFNMIFRLQNLCAALAKNYWDPTRPTKVKDTLKALFKPYVHLRAGNMVTQGKLLKKNKSNLYPDTYTLGFKPFLSEENFFKLESSTVLIVPVFSIRPIVANHISLMALYEEQLAVEKAKKQKKLAAAAAIAPAKKDEKGKKAPPAKKAAPASDISLSPDVSKEEDSDEDDDKKKKKQQQAKKKEESDEASEKGADVSSDHAADKSNELSADAMEISNDDDDDKKKKKKKKKAVEESSKKRKITDSMSEEEEKPAKKKAKQEPEPKKKTAPATPEGKAKKPEAKAAAKKGDDRGALEVSLSRELSSDSELSQNQNKKGSSKKAAAAKATKDSDEEEEEVKIVTKGKKRTREERSDEVEKPAKVEEVKKPTKKAEVKKEETKKPEAKTAKKAAEPKPKLELELSDSDVDKEIKAIEKVVAKRTKTVEKDNAAAAAVAPNKTDVVFDLSDPRDMALSHFIENGLGVWDIQDLVDPSTIAKDNYAWSSIQENRKALLSSTQSANFHDANPPVSMLPTNDELLAAHESLTVSGTIPYDLLLRCFALFDNFERLPLLLSNVLIDQSATLETDYQSEAQSFVESVAGHADLAQMTSIGVNCIDLIGRALNNENRSGALLIETSA